MYVMLVVSRDATPSGVKSCVDHSKLVAEVLRSIAIVHNHDSTNRIPCGTVVLRPRAS